MTAERSEFERPWHAHFNTHGDPFVVEDPKRPYTTLVATVSSRPEDYGRANALLIASAPDLLANNERLRAALTAAVEAMNTSWGAGMVMCRGDHALHEAIEAAEGALSGSKGAPDA